MVSKSSAPHSIRFRNELWERVSARAKRDGVTPNEAVIALVEAGLLRAAGEVGTLRPAKPPRAGSTPAPHSTQSIAAAILPLHKPKPFNPQPKRGKK